MLVYFVLVECVSLCLPPHYPCQAVKLDSPDYAGEEAEAAVADFRLRIQQYTQAYQPIDPLLDRELSWLKVFNVDQKYEANRIAGWWEGQWACCVLSLWL